MDRESLNYTIEQTDELTINSQINDQPAFNQSENTELLFKKNYDNDVVLNGQAGNEGTFDEPANQKLVSDPSLNKELVASGEPVQDPMFEAKKKGLWSGIAIVAGNMIGSGIFATVSGTTSAAPHSIGISLIFWIFGGFVAIIGALCYAELTLYVNKSGGEKTFLTQTFGTQFGIAYIYSYNVLVVPMSLTFGAITAATYITSIVVPTEDFPEKVFIVRLLAASILIGVLVLNNVSSKYADKIQIIFFVSKVISLILIIITGFVFLGKGGTKNFEDMWNVTDFDPFQLSYSLASSFWAYEGWNTLGHISGELKNAKKNLPICFIFGVSLVIILYLLTIISYNAVLGIEVINKSIAIGSSFGQVAFGKFAWVISIFIVLSTAGLVNGFLYTASRISMVSGVDGDIPYMYGLVHRKTRSPIISNTVLATIGLIFVPIDFSSLIDYASFVSWFFYFLSMCSLLYFRFKRKDLTSRFKVPIVFPFLVMIPSLFIIIMTFYSSYLPCTFILLYILVIFSIHFIPKKHLQIPIFKRFLGYISYGMKVGFNLEIAGISDLASV